MGLSLRFCLIIGMLLRCVWSSELGEWELCNDIDGTCFDTSKYNCSVPAVAGKCKGAGNIRCCPSEGGLKLPKCDGACKLVSTKCKFEFEPGKCPGPNEVQCCLKQAKEKPGDNGSVWNWLGPVTGAIATIIAAFITVFCVRRHRGAEGGLLREEPPPS